MTSRGARGSSHGSRRGSTSSPGAASTPGHESGFLPDVHDSPPVRETPTPVESSDDDSIGHDFTGEKTFITTVEGAHFNKRRETVRDIKRIMISTMVVEPHLTYAQISPETRGIIWEEFMKRYEWDPAETNAVRATVDDIGNRRLRDLLYRCRESNKKPTWMTDTVWLQYQEYWATPKWQALSATNKHNRASERAVPRYMGQSTYAEFGQQLEKELGRQVPKPEVFIRSRRGKKLEKDWRDQRSREFYENTIARAAQEGQSSDGSNTPVSVERMNQIYDEEAGRTTKGYNFARGGALPRSALSSSSTCSDATLSTQLQMKVELDAMRKDNEELRATVEQSNQRQARMEEQLQLLLSQQTSQQPQYSYRPQAGYTYQGGNPPPFMHQSYQYPTHQFSTYQHPPQSSSQPDSAYRPDLTHVHQQAGHGDNTDFVNALLDFTPPAPPDHQ